MKVKFVCDSGANIHSAREEIFDTEIDFSILDEEWNQMSEDEKYNLVKEWAWNRLEIYWEEV